MTDALAIANLQFSYDASPLTPPVVDIDTLRLAHAEQMLLTGTSGGGKSTLLHLIAGLIEPDRGSIHVAGQDMHALRGAKRDNFRGRTIGMIFQTFNLLPGFTAAENVMAALMFSDIPSKQHRDKAIETLAQLDIDRPDAMIDDMSIGQQQRVAVARAIVCEPALVLADEPTASLDPDNARVAMDLIQNACRSQGAALLCTSHDPALAARFERREALSGLSAAGTAAS